MKKSKHNITDWLDQYGNPEIEKQVEEEIMIKRFIERLKALRIGNSSNKHDCRENIEVIDKLPLFEGDSYMSPPKYYMGDTYNVKCKICGNSWWQNHP